MMMAATTAVPAIPPAIFFMIRVIFAPNYTAGIRDASIYGDMGHTMTTPSTFRFLRI
jgi:hypothetical protein